MNAMSVSPVKPAINPGNHAVPATATNLTKSPSGNFPPISLIPEAKPVPAVNAAPVTTENSVDLCSKPPTSNGIVLPAPETNIKENSTNAPQNHNEKSDTVQNLTSTDAPPKPAEVVSETKSVEKPKLDEPKNVTPSKENSEPVKETVPATPIESAKEPPKDEKPAQEEVKPESAVVNDVKDGKDSESHQTEVKASTEPVPEPKKETKSTPEKSQDKKEPESETSNEKDVQPEVNETEPSSESSATPKPATKRKAKAPVEPVEDDGKDGRKSKRVRLPTQPYQSPIPELQFIAKLQTPAKATPKPAPEKIIAFFKNEFLAVRNPEGSFYICQAFQNIHRNSSRIKIRWFTNLPNDEFTPDFFDQTEFDCILTNVTMSRVEKDRWKLPEVERTRVENILKRALDVEKGVAEQPSITEEHPDGLDLSLFKDEAQLKKKKKKKSASPKANKELAAASGAAKKPAKSKSKKSAKAVVANTSSTSSTKKSARLSNLSQTSAKETTPQKPAKPAENKTKKDKKKKKGKQGAAAKASSNAKQNDKAKVWEPSVKSSNSSKVVLSLKKETPPAASKTAAAETTTKAATKRTSSVSSRASATSTSPAAVPQKRRKEEPKAAAANQPTTNERTGKVRNAGSAVAAKINSAAMRTTKDKERKASNSSSQRKK